MNRRRACADREARQLGMETGITRRDFVSDVFVGATLLTTATLAEPVGGALELGPDWTGPGGIGDYARANGNTHEVVKAARSRIVVSWHGGG